MASTESQSPVALPVTDLESATVLYTSALRPLGYVLVNNVQTSLQHHRSITSAVQSVAFGPNNINRIDLVLSQSEYSARELHGGKAPHIVFIAASRTTVMEFYSIALNAGGTSVAQPEVSEHSQSLFLVSAIVADNDGNKLEARYWGTENSDTNSRSKEGALVPHNAGSVNKAIERWRDSVARSTSISQTDRECDSVLQEGFFPSTGTDVTPRASSGMDNLHLDPEPYRRHSPGHSDQASYSYNSSCERNPAAMTRTHNRAHINVASEHFPMPSRSYTHSLCSMDEADYGQKHTQRRHYSSYSADRKYSSSYTAHERHSSTQSTHCRHSSSQLSTGSKPYIKDLASAILGTAAGLALAYVLANPSPSSSPNRDHPDPPNERSQAREHRANHEPHHTMRSDMRRVSNTGQHPCGEPSPWLPHRSITYAQPQRHPPDRTCCDSSRPPRSGDRSKEASTRQSGATPRCPSMLACLPLPPPSPPSPGGRRVFKLESKPGRRGEDLSRFREFGSGRRVEQVTALGGERRREVMG